MDMQINSYEHVIFLFPRNITFPPRRGDSQRVFFIAEDTMNCGLGTSIFYYDNEKQFAYKGLKFYPLPGNVTADPSKTKNFSIFGAIKDLLYFSITIIIFKSKLREKSILYAHTPIGGLVGSIIKIFTRAPLIYDPHDWFYEDWVFYHRNLSNFKKTIISNSFKILNCILTKFSNFIICVSPEMMQAVKTNRFKVLIPNYAQQIMDKSKVEKNPIKVEDSKYILFVGHVAIYQGVINLLKAFKIVNQQEKDVKLLIVGDGEDMELAKQLVEKQGIINVTFTGSIPQEEVYRYIRKATLCVAPFLPLSFVKTSCPLKLLEYQRFGKDIITTDIPTFRKMLEGNTEVYFSEISATCLSETIMLALEKKKNRIIKTGKKSVEGYNKQKNQKSLCQLYACIKKSK